MIYSASRRTDLPAFYPDWLCERVRRSRKLEALVFWTKDPRHFYDHPGLRAVVERYPSVVQLTLTGLAGTAWEPGVPEPQALRPALGFLARALPPGAVRWRFDPILATPDLFARLEAMHALLRGAGLALEEVTVSFPTEYRKVAARLRAAGLAFPAVDLPARRRIIAEVMARTGLPAALCCQEALLGVPGARRAACVDHALFNRLYGTRFSGAPARGQRPGCGCGESTDVGSYEQTCGHGCLYCYAWQGPSDDA